MTTMNEQETIQALMQSMLNKRKPGRGHRVTVEKTGGNVAVIILDPPGDSFEHRLVSEPIEWKRGVYAAALLERFADALDSLIERLDDTRYEAIALLDAHGVTGSTLCSRIATLIQREKGAVQERDRITKLHAAALNVLQASTAVTKL